MQDLKMLRRVAFQRYSFGLAATIARKLRRKGVGPLWLWKDYALPRVPLALAVGYGIVLGSFKDWIGVLGSDIRFSLGLCAATLVPCWFLIYCNVRDRLGPGPRVGKRTWLVFGICAGWDLLSVLVGYWLAGLDMGLKKSFDWGVAATLACSSLVLAIVAQFFFAKAGSIADPL